MPEISKIDTIDLETGVSGVYDIKDAASRAGIGNLANLKTTEKSNLVSAVNELKEKLPPLYVTVTAADDVNCTEAPTYAEISAAKSGNRNVYCVYNRATIMPLINLTGSSAIFQVPIGRGADRRVIIYPDQTKAPKISLVEYAFKSDLGDYAKTTDLGGYVQTSDLTPYAKTSDLGSYAKKTDLNSYAKSTDLKPPLYVTLNNPNGTQWTADHTQAQIKEARDARRNVMCVLDYQGKNVVPFMYTSSNQTMFRGPIYVYADKKVVEATVLFVNGLNGVATVTTAEYTSNDDFDTYTKSSDLVRSITNENCFDITIDGVISLKPEYRGAAQTEDYPYAISDNGVGEEGSKIADLPEVIVMPQNVDGVEVTGFQDGMFYCNERVKEIVLSATVKTLPSGFAKEAIHLETLANTQQLEVIGSNALQQTRIRGLVCPNLTSLGSGAFQYVYCLRYADVGKIKTIPDNAFRHCSNLTEVCADSVTSIANQSFYGTRRLKSLSFLANVKSLGDGAFWSSRCDLEALPTDCVVSEEVGKWSSYKQFGSSDYWTGVTFTPCKNPLGSLFSQFDPRWADKKIEYTDSNGKVWAYGNDAFTYSSNGCGLFVLVEIYSALMGASFDSPEDIFPILEKEKVLGIGFRNRDEWCQIANGLGLGTEYITNMTTENLQKVYDALADGALLYKSTVSGISTNGQYAVDGGHAILGYGINSDGEMLTSDSSIPSHKVGIYENHKTAWNIYKHGSELCDCVIVRKPK